MNQDDKMHQGMQKKIHYLLENGAALLTVTRTEQATTVKVNEFRQILSNFPIIMLC